MPVILALVLVLVICEPGSAVVQVPVLTPVLLSSWHRIVFFSPVNTYP